MCRPNKIQKVWIVTDTNVGDFLRGIDNIVDNTIIHDIKITETDNNYTATLIQYAEVF